jgi:hypothetical protein
MNPISQELPEFLTLDEESTDAAVAAVTALAKPGRDDRKSCRFNVPQARQSCELKVGHNVLSASLLNASRDGFAVLIDRTDGLSVGKKIELHTNMGWFTVRIVYINKVGRPQGVPPECDSWFRVGMRIKRRLQPGRPLP